MSIAIANGPIINGYNNSGLVNGFDFQSSASDFTPLSQDGTESMLDPIAAMEKSLSHHEQHMGPPAFANDTTNVNNSRPQPHNHSTTTSTSHQSQSAPVHSTPSHGP